MSAVTIYHNPRCSKSRQTLALLEAQGVNATIIEYLDNPPNKQELKRILKLLGCSPREIIRNNEQAYKDLALNDKDLSDEQLITAMIEHPKLIQRPIVVHGERAALGRPPENVLEII